MTGGTETLRELLLEELGAGVRTTKKLLARVRPGEWDFRPADNMRSLGELANHLAQIPFVDLAILQEKSEEEVRRLESEHASSDPEKLCEWMEEGFQSLCDYMRGLDEESFLTRRTKPFYADHGSTQAKWLVEIVTHVYHHRAQLFQYLKQLAIRSTCSICTDEGDLRRMPAGGHPFFCVFDFPYSSAMRKRILAPPPGALPAVIHPPCFSARVLAIYIPRPACPDFRAGSPR